MLKASLIIKNLLTDLSPRQKEFLEERFGLNDGQKKTLQELGDRHKITRERVRQIESEALKISFQNFKKSDGVKFVDISKNHLKSLGGVRKEDDFVNDLKYVTGDNSLNKSQLKVLFAVAGNPIFYNEDENFHGFWYLDRNFLKKADNFVGKSAKFFSSKKEDLISKNKLGDFLAQFVKSYGIKEPVALNYLAVSKKFGVNPYNDFGLSHWEEINPKTARSKAYLILKKNTKPLHFRDIADVINKTGFDKKPVYAQTIHNELIKDPRFVLVGRGIYTLKEHGYFPGTAKDVIRKILKDKGPLQQKQILELVAQQRFLKENTILLNLQNRKQFKRLQDGRYHLA